MNDINNPIVRFMDVYYKKNVKSKYNIDLKFSNPRIIKNNVIEHVSDLNFYSDEVIIDALFGSGLTRIPETLALEVINKMNNSGIGRSFTSGSI